MNFVKKITRNIVFKFIAVLLILACSFGLTITLWEVKDIENPDAILQPSYLESDTFALGARWILESIISSSGDKNNVLSNQEGVVFHLDETGIFGTTSETKGFDIDDFNKINYRVVINDGSISAFPQNTYFEEIIENYISDTTSEFINSGGTLNFALEYSYYDSKIEQWNSEHKQMEEILILSGIFAFIFLIALLYLIKTAGKSGADEKIKMTFTDKIHTEIILFIILLVIGVVVNFVDDFMTNYNMYSNLINSDFIEYLAGVAVALIVGVLLFFGMSLIRHIKNGTIIKNSLIYIFLNQIVTIIVNIFSNGSLMLKLMSGLVIFGLACSGLTFLMIEIGMYSRARLNSTILIAIPIIITMSVILYLFYNNVKSYKNVMNSINSIKSGNYSNLAEVKGNSEIAMLARSINSIGEGLDIAVKNEVKSERLKSELITNVSHDIKTPLTSIITYVDLLKKEGLTSENAPKYLEVLDVKSQRLKVLTEDLVEASKASSGDIPVSLSKIDLSSLIQQGMAELHDKVVESRLHYKINLPEEKIIVTADGKLLWRVIENLLSNTFKYALKDSRVYLDVFSDKENAYIVIKNISAYELNIKVDELTERFKRGDESRNSEGSGLGLAIAKDLAEIQKGSLSIEIDGDLFKATVSMPLANLD